MYENADTFVELYQTENSNNIPAVQLLANRYKECVYLLTDYLNLYGDLHKRFFILNNYSDAYGLRLPIAHLQSNYTKAQLSSFVCNHFKHNFDFPSFDEVAARYLSANSVPTGLMGCFQLCCCLHQSRYPLPVESFFIDNATSSVSASGDDSESVRFRAQYVALLRANTLQAQQIDQLLLSNVELEKQLGKMRPESGAKCDVQPAKACAQPNCALDGPGPAALDGPPQRRAAVQNLVAQCRALEAENALLRGRIDSQRAGAGAAEQQQAEIDALLCQNRALLAENGEIRQKARLALQLQRAERARLESGLEKLRLQAQQAEARCSAQLASAADEHSRAMLQQQSIIEELRAKMAEQQGTIAQLRLREHETHGLLRALREQLKRRAAPCGRDHESPDEPRPAEKRNQSADGNDETPEMRNNIQILDGLQRGSK